MEHSSSTWERKDGQRMQWRGRRQSRPWMRPGILAPAPLAGDTAAHGHREAGATAPPPGHRDVIEEEAGHRDVIEREAGHRDVNEGEVGRAHPAAVTDPALPATAIGPALPVDTTGPALVRRGGRCGTGPPL